MRRTILASVSVLVLCGVVSGYEREISWIPGEFSPDFSISPEEPTATDLIHFTVPTGLFESRRDAEWKLGGTPTLSIDPDTRTIRLRFQGEPSAPISEFYNPVCGLRGYFGPLERGTWLFDVFFPGTIWRVNINVNPPDQNVGGVKAEYFRGMSLRGEPDVWIEDAIDHQWGDGEIAYDLSNQVSARWTADLKITDADTYTFVTNSDDGVRLWLDGERIINNWTDHGPTFDTSAPMYLVPGLYSLQMEWYENTGGAVAQLFWQTPDRQRSIIQAGPAGPLQLPVSAGSPYPHDGAFNVSQSLTLSWTAGEGAVRHRVYFGENFNAVNTGTGGTNQIPTFFVVGSAGSPYPNGLGPDTTYFWRVDEVQTDGTTRRGKVWRFTTAVFSVDEDFEGFKDEDGWRISDTWIREGGATGPYIDQTTVFSGEQSMLFEYNNTGNVDYSEAKRTFDPPQDWEDGYVDALILFVYGRTNNVADTLYIKIQDDAGRAARVEHPDPDVLLTNNWIGWRIPLIEFEFANAGINLNRIKTMSIGVGGPGPLQPLPDGFNDDCANAIHIGNVTNLPFDTTNATFDGPGHYNTGDNVWYRYTAPRTCDVTIDLCDSSYDTKLVVYDGWDCYPAYWDIIARANDNCGQYGLRSKVTFAAIAGHRYLIEIGGDTGSDWGPGLMTIGCEVDLNSPILRDGPKLFANSDGEEEEGEGVGDFNADNVVSVGRDFRTLMGTVSKANKPISGATVTLEGAFKNDPPTGSDGFYAVLCQVKLQTNYNVNVKAPPDFVPRPFNPVIFGQNWIKTKDLNIP
jgi:hypothetical protein